MGYGRLYAAMEDRKLSKLVQDNYTLWVELPLTRHVALPVALPASRHVPL